MSIKNRIRRLGAGSLRAAWNERTDAQKDKTKVIWILVLVLSWMCFTLLAWRPDFSPIEYADHSDRMTRLIDFEARSRFLEAMKACDDVPGIDYPGCKERVHDQLEQDQLRATLNLQ